MGFHILAAHGGSWLQFAGRTQDLVQDIYVGPDTDWAGQGRLAVATSAFSPQSQLAL